jgi:UDP-N-acetylmuramate dehydrogenase
VGPQELDFSYRHARLPPGAFISRARLRLCAEGLEEESQRVAHHLSRRKATQPLELPSCGSVFKNPPGDHAGRLIEAAGLKGRALGGARISDKHANFIVNEGGALASEVRALVRLARDEVWSRFAVALEPEVHAIGRHPVEEWPLPPPPLVDRPIASK